MIDTDMPGDGPHPPYESFTRIRNLEDFERRKEEDKRKLLDTRNLDKYLKERCSPRQ
jgi:hypothetical protein